MTPRKESEPNTLIGILIVLAKSSPTAVALLIMFWIGTNILKEGLAQQAEIMRRQAEFNITQTKQQSDFNAAQVVYNAQQNQFNQQILKALDEITKSLIDLHADVGNKDPK